MGLMAFSVMIAVIGIGTAYRFYVLSPQTADGLKERFAGAHSLLYNKYFVDELYNSTFVARHDEKLVRSLGIRSPGG